MSERAVEEEEGEKGDEEEREGKVITTIYFFRWKDEDLQNYTFVGQGFERVPHWKMTSNHKVRREERERGKRREERGRVFSYLSHLLTLVFLISSQLSFSFSYR